MNYKRVFTFGKKISNEGIAFYALFHSKNRCVRISKIRKSGDVQDFLALKTNGFVIYVYLIVTAHR